jgi:hypothetical protein
MLIKEYTTKPLREHDTDYPWYRPGNIPANTCSYPYEFAYTRAYPTYTVTETAHIQTCTCLPCLDKKNNGAVQPPKEKSTFQMLWIVFLIIIGVFLASALLR